MTADRRCLVRIDLVGEATVASWYEIWEAVTAIAAMCTRHKGKGGRARGLGKFLLQWWYGDGMANQDTEGDKKNIFIVLSDLESDPDFTVGTTINVTSANPSLGDDNLYDTEQ